MRYHKKSPEDNHFLKKWEINLLLSLIVLLVMATIVDLDLSIADVLSFLIN